MPESTPAVNFREQQIVSGALETFPQKRSQIISDVVHRSTEELKTGSLDLLLGEALYSEKRRLRRNKPTLFTRKRAHNDKKLWAQIYSGLIKSSGEVDRNSLLEQVVRHYSDEIAGNFDPKVYDFAVRLVPLGLNWLLNAASVKHFMPWRMTENLQSTLSVVGEVSTLQKLAQKGTILLVPTHQSNIDSMLIGYVIYLMRLPPFAYGAGLNLFSNPVFSFFMNHLGTYKVDRQKNNAIYKNTLKNYSTRLLKEDVHSIFFPGGGRARSGAIETHLKLGLLGTGIQAQIENYQAGKAKPSIFVVPMVTSYDFVLEASSLIEDHLAEAGKNRFFPVDEDPWQGLKTLKFFWKLFSSQSGMTVRIGKPMDVFGNFVDEEGRSYGPGGRTIDPKHWLTSRGVLATDLQRDQEYTRELGTKLVSRYHKENTVLPSHVIAFALFESLRNRYPELDLYRFLRLSLAQRSLPLPDFKSNVELVVSRLQNREAQGDLFLAPELRSGDLKSWFNKAVLQLGFFHDSKVVAVDDQSIWTEDLSLLYYYRNRLSGYNLTGHYAKLYDEKGFLA